MHILCYLLNQLFFGIGLDDDVTELAATAAPADDAKAEEKMILDIYEHLKSRFLRSSNHLVDSKFTNLLTHHNIEPTDAHVASLYTSNDRQTKDYLYTYQKYISEGCNELYFF